MKITIEEIENGFLVEADLSYFAVESHKVCVPSLRRAFKEVVKLFDKAKVAEAELKQERSRRGELIRSLEGLTGSNTPTSRPVDAFQSRLAEEKTDGQKKKEVKKSE